MENNRLVINMTGSQGTYPHEVYRLYSEANIERRITERWPDLRPGDWIRVTVERISPNLPPKPPEPQLRIIKEGHIPARLADPDHPQRPSFFTNIRHAMGMLFGDG
jgi:hypothetical protein